eukprot:ANDGO_03421.mRNA.1 hypothetical protein
MSIKEATFWSGLGNLRRSIRRNHTKLDRHPFRGPDEFVFYVRYLAASLSTREDLHMISSKSGDDVRTMCTVWSVHLTNLADALQRGEYGIHAWLAARSSFATLGGGGTSAFKASDKMIASGAKRPQGITDMYCASRFCMDTPAPPASRRELP